jgi:hypothetical protein
MSKKMSKETINIFIKSNKLYQIKDKILESGNHYEVEKEQAEKLLKMYPNEIVKAGEEGNKIKNLRKQLEELKKENEELKNNSKKEEKGIDNSKIDLKK